MKLAPSLIGFLGCVFLASAQPARDAAAGRPPNVILIFCDDLGYGDVGLYGQELQRTPNLQRLGAEGIVLESFYSTSGVCTPSRSSLMTGSYPRRINLHEAQDGAWVLFPQAQRGLHPDEVTVAEILRARGYATGMIGKWHLGDQPEFLPTRQGFDSWFGIPYSNNMYYAYNGRHTNWPPLPLLREERVIEVDPDQSRITARYTYQAAAFIHEHRERPFFLYLAHTMPHFPIAASDAFRGKSPNGIHGDAIEELDWSTGRIMQALRDYGLDENTLVIFTSDNGAEGVQKQSNLPLAGHKGQTMEGGMRVPFVARWPGRIPAGIRSNAITSTMDLLPTLAALAGAERPKGRAIDGHDIRPILFGQPDAASPYEAFYYYYIDQLQAVRAGPWKLRVAREGNPNRGEPAKVAARLYNLDEDIAERVDLAAQHPQVVKRLEAFAERARVELGDRNRPGAGQRPAGFVRYPAPLVIK